MWKKLAVGGAVAAAIVGVGTAAVATSGSLTAGDPTPATSSASAAPGPGARPHGPLRDHPFARRALHGTWVTRDPNGSGFVTHSEIRGTVTAVSSTSITVKAADDFTATYVVNSDTKVRVRTDGKGAAGTISQIATGDNVAVVGPVSGSTATARGILKLAK